MILKKLLEKIVLENQITVDQILIIELVFKKDFIFLEKFLQIEKQRGLLLQNLIRREYLNLYDTELTYDILTNIYVTDKGEEVLYDLKNQNKELIDEDFNLTSFEEKFEEFWDLFPSSDKYMHFPRTRILRTEQEKCKKMYRKILDEYNHEDVIKALKYELNMREHNSVSGINKLFSDFKYMKASSTWLNNKEFLAIQEIMKDDNNEKIDIFTRDV